MIKLAIYCGPTKTPLYLDLYQKLREQIESGAFPVGYKLPSEKQIAEENGVSRITSKHALDQLVSEGYIKRFPGKGSFVQAQSGNSAYETAPAARPSAPARPARLIGVLMEDIAPNFGGGILMGVERMCAEAGYSVVLKFSYGDEKREIACVDEMLEAGVCGIMVMCAYSEIYSPTIMKLSLDNFPMVFMDRSLRGLPVPYVSTNHQAAARELTHEMIRRGHRHLALALIEDSHTTSSVEDRVLGYIDGCLDHDLLCANKRIALMREDGHQVDPNAHRINLARIRDYLRDNPETRGILALTSVIADSLLHALADIPCDGYTVAAFDGPPDSGRADCELFYIEQDQEMIGRTACRLLIEKLAGRPAPHHTFIPYQLIDASQKARDAQSILSEE